MSAADFEREIALTNEKVIAIGSFGIVYKATMVETGETVAVKKVLQDKRYKVFQLCVINWLSLFGNISPRHHRIEKFR